MAHDFHSRKPYLELYPEIAPYSSGFLDVSDIHTLYWEQSGNPDGVPVVYLHGGPGAGSSPKHRRYFDPDHYRIIVFDQRGAGRSTPLGCLEDNTLAFLLEDMETLRKHLKIDKWHLFGGSWGSTLALAYAQSYPDHVISMTMRGIFTLSKSEIDWFLYGIKNIFPEAWEQFASAIPEDEQDNLLAAYHKRLTSPDDKERIGAAITWSLYEGACASLFPNYETITTEEQKMHAQAMARIESYYFLNQIIPDEHSLTVKHNIDKIRHIPATIIHGRYDILCPIKTAYELHTKWPEADYVVVPDAGHSSSDSSVKHRLIQVMENAKSL